MNMLAGNSSHLTFLEERELYIQVGGDFLARTEAADRYHLRAVAQQDQSQ
jgi:hypothetical protein